MAAQTRDQAAPSGKAAARPPGAWLVLLPGQPGTRCVPVALGAAAAGARLSPQALLSLQGGPSTLLPVCLGASAPLSPGPPPQPQGGLGLPALQPGLGAFLAPLPPSGSYQPEPPAPMCPWQAHAQGQGSRVPPLWAPTDGAPFGGGWGGAVLETCRAPA